MSIVASWKIDGMFKADAVKVANEIKSIGNEIKPRDLVEKGRDETTELHKCFDWNDEKAAEKYRVIQAKAILRTIVIKKVSENSEKQTNHRMFSYITAKATEQKTSGAFKQTISVYQNPDQYQDLLKQAIRELESFRHKYQSLNQLSKVFEAIDEIIT